jgi:hypothetical protein
MVLLLSPVLGVGVALNSGLAAALLPALGGILLLALVVRYTTRSDPADHRRWVALWTVAAFTGHFGLGLVIWHSSTLTGFFGGDAVTYNDLAGILSDTWKHGGAAPALPGGREGFFYLLAGLYFVFGQHAESGLAVNATMAALIVPLTHDTTRRAFGRDAARIATPLATVIPGLIIWPAQLLREAAVLMLLALALNLATRLADRISVFGITILAGTVALLFSMRASTASLMAVGVAAALLLGQRRFAGGIAASAGAVTALVVLMLVLGLGLTGFKLITSTTLTQINIVRADSSASAVSGYFADADLSTGTHVVTYLPIGIAAFLFGPPPWLIRGFRQVAALPDLLVWWFLLPSLWTGLRIGARRIRRQILVFVLPALFVSAGLSLIIANFGTTIRERMQVVIMLVPVIAFGFAQRRGRSWFRRGASHPANPDPTQPSLPSAQI